MLEVGGAVVLYEVKGQKLGLLEGVYEDARRGGRVCPVRLVRVKWEVSNTMLGRRHERQVTAANQMGCRLGRPHSLTINTLRVCHP